MDILNTTPHFSFLNLSKEAMASERRAIDLTCHFAGEEVARQEEVEDMYEACERFELSFKR